MKIAILHHHLNRGGVTQVILNHVRCLATARREPTHVLVLHGGRQDAWPNEPFEGQRPENLRLTVDSVDGLDYDDGKLRIDELAVAISDKLQQHGFGPEQTLLHIHNHSLGKSVSLPGAISRLASSGYRMLLQIHDFAEDLRPANFARLRTALGDASTAEVAAYLYPQADHIHYALLNRRDNDIFLTTGISAERVFLLPNPVFASGSLPDHSKALSRFRQTHGLGDEQQVVLYPVRGIRRKNLGEMLLWAALADERHVFALTLPATSEAELPGFRRWVQLAQELQLPVLWDVGLADGLTYLDNLAAAHRLLTTSVAEGFGLVFLESWLNGRPLIGRDLPEITADFVDNGVDLSRLSDRLSVPIDWIDKDTYIRRCLSELGKLSSTYGQELPSAERVLRDSVEHGEVDFAALGIADQADVIRRVTGDREAARELLNRNPFIEESLQDDDGWSDLIERNATAVRTAYSYSETAARLEKVYSTLGETEPGNR